MQYSSERLAPCLLRVALGVFCIRLGLWGYVEEAQFRTAIEVYAGFNGVGLTLYSIIGPLLLFAAGGLLILGLFTKVAALLAIAIFLPLVVAAGAVGVLENPLVLIPEKRTIYKDLVLLDRSRNSSRNRKGRCSWDASCNWNLQHFLNLTSPWRTETQPTFREWPRPVVDRDLKKHSRS
jgi:uncharacterized membrane protein YphA (DoxX/SURF4 family)